MRLLVDYGYCDCGYVCVVVHSFWSAGYDGNSSGRLCLVTWSEILCVDAAAAAAVVVCAEGAAVASVYVSICDADSSPDHVRVLHPRNMAPSLFPSHARVVDAGKLHEIHKKAFNKECWPSLISILLIYLLLPSLP